MLHNMRNVSVMWRDTHTQAGPHQFEQTERTSMELIQPAEELDLTCSLWCLWSFFLIRASLTLWFRVWMGTESVETPQDWWGGNHPAQSCQNNRTQIRWTECDEQTKRDMKYRRVGGVPEVTAVLPYGHTSNGLCLISWRCFIVRAKTLITTSVEDTSII